MNWWQKHWEALAVGAGLGVVGLILWEKRATATVVAPVIVTPPAPAPTPVPSSGATLTLSPNVPAISLGATIGSQQTVALPAGARWINDGTGPATGNAPVTFTYQGPGTVNYTWVDSTMQPQTTALTYYTQAF